MHLILLMALSQGADDLTHFGNKWAWHGPGREEVFAAQLVMYATPPNFRGQPDKIDRDSHTFLVQHGFHGFHVFLSCRWFDIEEEDCRNVPGTDPAIDPRTLDALEMLIVKTIFYREDTEELGLGLNAMDGVHPAVAVDTRKPYAEIRIGELDPKRHLWEAPYPSDWAIAVGSFERPPRGLATPPPVPTTPELTDFVRSTYPVSILREGERYYTDRDYTLAVVPSFLDGAVWIRTTNDEKAAEREPLLTFEVTRDVVVYVGFDRRAARLPEWLRSFEAVGERLHVNGDVMGYFELYRRAFPRGEVTLGATSARGADFGDAGRSQYVVAIVAR